MMRVLIDIGHPAHVHFYKNTIKELKDRGHEVLVTARDKDVAINLLKAYKIDFIPVGKIGNTKLDLINEWTKRDYEIFKIARKFQPDVLMGMLNPCAGHSAKLLGKKCFIFNDSEVVNSTAMITYPFHLILEKILGVNRLESMATKNLHIYILIISFLIKMYLINLI